MQTSLTGHADLQWRSSPQPAHLFLEKHELHLSPFIPTSSYSGDSAFGTMPLRVLGQSEAQPLAVLGGAQSSIGAGPFPSVGNV